MIEIGIMVVVTLAFFGSGLAVWRCARGPVKRRRGLAPRITVLSLMSIVLAPTSAWELSKSRTFQCFEGYDIATISELLAFLGG